MSATHNLENNKNNRERIESKNPFYLRLYFTLQFDFLYSNHTRIRLKGARIIENRQIDYVKYAMLALFIPFSVWYARKGVRLCVSVAYPRITL